MLTDYCVIAQHRRLWYYISDLGMDGSSITDMVTAHISVLWCHCGFLVRRYGGVTVTISGHAKSMRTALFRASMRLAPKRQVVSMSN